MDSMDKIDKSLDSALKATGSSIEMFRNEIILGGMREAMRKIMAESYLQGRNDTRHALSKYHTTSNRPGLEMDNDENQN